MLQDGFFDPRKPLQIRWGELPHWRQEGALYFVTFRLADSLPRTKLAEWRRARDEWRRENPRPSREELQKFSLQQRRQIERWLDRGAGACLLRNAEARSIVETSIRHFEGTRYELGELAIAPNHVHVLTRTAPGVDLSDVLFSWKRHSSGEIKRQLQIRRRAGERGHLWQVESFDHIVRDYASLERITRYIRRHEEFAN